MDSDQERPMVKNGDATAGAGRSRQILIVRLLANRPARRALLLLAMMLGAVAPTPVSSGGARSAAAQSAPTVVITPAQGTAGTVIQISAEDFPGSDYHHTEIYLLDNTAIGSTPAFVLCDSQPGGAQTNFGFGTACQSAAAPVTLTIPSAAAPGPHTIGISDQTGLTGSTTFTVTIPQQPTVTPTGTPVPPAASATGTVAPSTPTPPPNSTATSTPGPASPTATPPATATATPTPKPAFPLVVLVYPLHLFSGGTLALSLHTLGGTHITMTLEFTAAATTGHGHGAIHAGAVLYKHQIHGTANGAGRFGLTLYVAYTPPVRARAMLIITARHGATTFTARRVYG